MTSKTFVSRAVADAMERFPDFPPRDDMQNPIHLGRPAIIAALDFHFEGSETTLVLGEVPVAMNVEQTRAGVRIPDLIVAFDVGVPGIIERNGFAINLVGKPPDFVLEVASPTTGRRDYTEKRRDYERFGIPEYWRFDGTGGEYHDAPMAGDRLVDGRYNPIEVEWSSQDKGRGYSEVLGLYLCWEEGRLRFFDPKADGYLLTYHETIERADQEAQRAEQATRRAEQAAEEVRRLGQRLRDLGEEYPC